MNPVTTAALRAAGRRTCCIVTAAATSQRRSKSTTAAKSYAIGAQTPALLDNVTIGQQLELTADEIMATSNPASPDYHFVTFAEEGIKKNWADMLADVDSLAVGLLDLGYIEGDRIGVWLPNYYEWVLMQFACHRIGLILVNINPAYRVAELKYALNKVRVKGLLMTDAYKTSDYNHLITMLIPALKDAPAGGLAELQCEEVPSLKHIFSISSASVPGAIRVSDVKVNSPMNASRVHAVLKRVRPHDACNIQFTSGTTGHPKPASLSHYNILNNALLIGDRMGYNGKTDKICIPVPLYHCFGTVIGVLCGVAKGVGCVFPSPGFDEVATLRAVEDHRCTSLYGVPTMFIKMLAESDATAYDLSTLRTGVMAGSICPPATMRRLYTDYKMNDVVIAYGMTETSPVSWLSFPDTPEELKCTTVGQVMPHTECKVVDGDGRVAPAGEVGELCTRGYLVMNGYDGSPEDTADAIDEDGWIHTGDLATIDAEGYCRIVGRKRDMIIRGGENIYPAEVEKFLHECDDVADVAVLGLPHEVFGEQVAAFIIPAAGAAVTLETVRAFCKDQIAHFKIPTKVVVVDEFPLTATGKIQKYILKEQYLAGAV